MHKMSFTSQNRTRDASLYFGSGLTTKEKLCASFPKKTIN